MILLYIEGGVKGKKFAPSCKHDGAVGAPLLGLRSRLLGAGDLARELDLVVDGFAGAGRCVGLGEGAAE